MHELSIAMSIVDMVQEEAQERGVKINAVHLRLGALAGVVQEALLASYEMACCDTSLQGSQLVIENLPVLVYCPACDARTPLRSLQLFCCAECGSPTSDVVQGRELQVVALEVQ